MVVLGTGELVSGVACSGLLHRANTLDEIRTAMRLPDLAETVLLTESATATAITPLLARVRAIVCQSGGETSHVAIVSREFGITCVMGVEEFAHDQAPDGIVVAIDADGAISAP